MRTVVITLAITYDDLWQAHPSAWAWEEILDLDPREQIRIVRYEDAPLGLCANCGDVATVVHDAGAFCDETCWDAYVQPCNTCGGTGRWESTTEDNSETLVDLGPCPDCRGEELR